jgi:beta-1,4-mannosyltransferase
MHNSGALILALSLRRPALVPRTPTTEALSAEVGEGWIHLYDGDLNAADLAIALHAQAPTTPPDLTARDWFAIGEQHVRAYVTSMGRGVATAGAGRGAAVGPGPSDGAPAGPDAA